MPIDFRTLDAPKSLARRGHHVQSIETAPLCALLLCRRPARESCWSLGQGVQNDLTSTVWETTQACIDCAAYLYCAIRGACRKTPAIIVKLYIVDL